MRFLFRAIFFGILTGAILFFFPFHFFLFPIVMLFIFIRIFFRPWRWRHRHHLFGFYGGYPQFAGFGSMPDDETGFMPVTPIDGFSHHRQNRSEPGRGRDISIQ